MWSAWFLAAVVAAAAVIVFGVAARHRGGVMLVDPTSVYNTPLGRSTWEFQRNAVYFAGRHFAANKATVESKQRAVPHMTCLFLIALACLFLRVVRS